MKRALALVVGNGNYNDKDDCLKNAVSDAVAIAEKLHNVGFNVILLKDCDKISFEKALKNFEKQLESYTTSLFYYSGHAFQIDRENYLSAVDSNFEDEDFAKNTCIPLQIILKKMSRYFPDVKIVILDACRTSPIKESYRGQSENLAPVKAPKGSFIAFSTSPGEKAADFGKGRHSIYTGCLLEHLEDPDVSIEVLFKRVRVSVVNISKGKQTPWEHTSMIDDFYFNPKGLTQSIIIHYDSQSIIYSQYVPKGNKVDSLITNLFSTQFDQQNQSALEVPAMADAKLTPSEAFLLGRSFLSAAHYGAFKASKKFQNMETWIPSFEQNGENHFLNGILFEIYFDQEGQLRKENYKSSLLNEIFNREKEIKFSKSFNFLREQLQPHRNYLFYLPGDPIVTIDLIFEETQIKFLEVTKKSYILNSMKIGTRELVTPTKINKASDYTEMSKFKEIIVNKLLIPATRIKIITNCDIEHNEFIIIPSSLKLSQIMKGIA